MNKKQSTLVILPLAIVGVVALTMMVGLIMVGMEEIHLEAWKN